VATQVVRPVRPGSDVGIAELIGRLTDDSKRLASDEVRLAKLELGESIRTGSRGAVRLALSFGIGVIALAGLTVLLTVVIGTLLIGKTWAGALVTGALELGVGLWLVRHGVGRLQAADITFGESRRELRATAARLTRSRIS
jgi:hypothetical protein